MTDTLQKFKDIFRGCESAYGKYVVEYVDEDKNKQTGHGYTVKKPVTDELWQQHLEGKEDPLGVVPFVNDTDVHWGCIDIDIYTGFDHKNLINEIRKQKLPFVVCRSKSGGAHVFVFFKDTISAVYLRKRLDAARKFLGYPKAEIFPKQDNVNFLENNYGNWLNLPYYDGDQSFRYAYKDDGSRAVLQDFFALHEQYVQTEETFKAVKIPDKARKREMTDQEIESGAPPCVGTMLNDGVEKGYRNNAMFNVAVFCRKAYGAKWKEKVEEYNAKIFPEGKLGLDELANIINSVNKKSYEYQCKIEPQCSLCDKEQCLTKRYGVGGGDDGLEEFFIEALTKVETEPPTWYATIRGKIVKLSTSELNNQNMLIERCMDKHIFGLQPLPPTRYRAMLAALADTENFQIQEVPQEDKLSGLLWDHIGKYCSKGKDKSDQLERGHAFKDDEAQIFFINIENLHKYLKKQEFRHYDFNDLVNMFNREYKDFVIKKKFNLRGGKQMKTYGFKFGSFDIATEPYTIKELPVEAF